MLFWVDSALTARVNQFIIVLLRDNYATGQDACSCALQKKLSTIAFALTGSQHFPAARVAWSFQAQAEVLRQELSIKLVTCLSDNCLGKLDRGNGGFVARKVTISSMAGVLSTLRARVDLGFMMTSRLF